MSAIVLPYPLVRRCTYISRQAEQMACMNDRAAARYLSHQLQVQRDAMCRRGVPQPLIEREIRNMEAAIRRQFEAITGAA
jgi:uncharacterized protein DUF6074